MFYSKSTNGFYTEAIHGALRLTIVDPAWVHPQIEVVITDPVTGETLDRYMADDPNIAAPQIEVDNPASKIPADAVKITIEEHADLLAGQARGKQIVPNESGFPVLQDSPAPTHAHLVERALTMTREERQPIISVLDGLQASALARGDSASAVTIEAVKQGLRDITKVDLSTCATLDDMRVAVMVVYTALVQANPSVALAFKGVLS